MRRQLKCKRAAARCTPTAAGPQPPARADLGPDGAIEYTRARSRRSTSGSTMADQELDARGLSCPLPILKTKKALNAMQSGQTLRVLATDPGCNLDFHAFA